MLSDVFSTITSSLPILKISKWDVQVLKEQKLKDPKPDDFISGIIKNFKNTIREIQDTVASIFQNVDNNYLSIAEFDSFISFNGIHDTQLVQNAVESGSFRSVNKIKKPTQVVVELAKGGYRSGIEVVLDTLKKYQGSTKIFRVMTPFGNIQNLNLMKLEYSYTRDNGSNLLIAKLTFQEVMTGYVRNKDSKYQYLKSPDLGNTKDVGRIAQQVKQ